MRTSRNKSEHLPQRTTGQQLPKELQHDFESALLQALTKLLSSNQGSTPPEAPRPEPIIVYDEVTPEDQPSSCQSPKASQKGLEERIVELCTGKRSIAQVCSLMERETGAEITSDMVYSAIERSVPDIRHWRARPLDVTYPLIWVDGCRIRCRDDKMGVASGTLYSLVGVDSFGMKDIIGQWVCRRESTQFWTSVLTELRNRGVRDILMMSYEGKPELGEALSGVYPDTLPIPSPGHQVASAMRFFNWKDSKVIYPSLKSIWLAESKESGDALMEEFTKTWSEHYPLVVKHLSERWKECSAMLIMDGWIRRLACTPAPMRRFHPYIDTAFTCKEPLPSESTVLKLAWLAGRSASCKWTTPVQNWAEISQSLSSVFGNRFNLF